MNVFKTIEGPNPIDINTEGTWDLVITVENTSEETVTNIIVTDEVIDNLTITRVVSDPPAIINGQTVTWNIPQLEPKEIKTLTISVIGSFSEVGPTGSLNSGRLTIIDSDDINFFDSGIEVIELPAFLNVSKIVDGPDQIDVNTEGTWDLVITVDNPSSETVTDIHVEDEVISNLMITKTASEPPADVSGQTVTWDIPELTSGDSNVLRITVTGSFSEEGPTGSLNSGILTAAEIVDTVSFVDSGITVTEATEPVIEIMKIMESGPKEIVQGQEGTWELLITVTNPEINTEAIAGIIVRDYVNSEIDIFSIELAGENGTAEYDDQVGRINWYGFDLEVGESATLRITLTGLFSAQGHKVLNSGSGYGTGADTGLTTNFADFGDSGITVIGATQPVIEIVKTFESGPKEIEQDQEGTWELLITVTNPEINTEALVDINVEDYMNLELEFHSVGFNPQTGNVSFEETTRKITWDDFNLKVGESTTLRITLTGRFSEEGYKVLNNGSGSGIGQDTGFQTDFARFEDSGITVIGQTLLTVSKIVVGPDPIDVNTEGTWDLVITVDNPSSDVVTDLQLTDEVIGNLVITGTVSEPSASYEGQGVKWDIPQLEPEESKTLIITVTGSFSEEGHTGSLNSGTLRAYGIETIEFFDSGITVTGQTLLDVYKIVEGPDPIEINTEGSWDLVITVNNLSEDYVSDVYVKDEVIDNLTITGTVSDPPASFSGQYVKWEIPQLEPKESKTLRVTVTGSFSEEGPTGSLNAGTLIGYEMEPIEFYDSGITVTDQTVLNVSSIIEGPDQIDVNTEGIWDLIMTVENQSSTAVTRATSTRAAVTDINVINEVISNLRITGTVSDPPASVDGQIVTWDILQLDSGESKTLRITVEGYFSTEGPTGSLCIGTLAASGMEPIEFVDSGIIVMQSSTPPTRGIDLFTEIE